MNIFPTPPDSLNFSLLRCSRKGYFFGIYVPATVLLSGMLSVNSLNSSFDKLILEPENESMIVAG